MKDRTKEQQPSAVPERAQQGGDIRARWAWVEPAVWTERMLATLEKGIEGGKWFRLIDKVWNPKNLAGSLQKVVAKGGSAGIDNQSAKAVEAHQEQTIQKPDPRFLGASLWIIVLWAVGTTIDRSSPEKRSNISRMIVCLFWVSVILAFVRNGPALTTSTGGKLAQSVPTLALAARTTRSGLVVYTPLPGSYCWDGKLPCTPFFRPQLKLRGTSLAEGFDIDESIDQAPDF